MNKYGVVLLKYNDAGTLRGKVPNGQYIIIRHLKAGPSNYEVIWEGRSYRWLYSGLVEDELRIVVHRKKTGLQTGRPSEAVLRAIWRYMVDQYNSRNPEISYSAVC